MKKQLISILLVLGGSPILMAACGTDQAADSRKANDTVVQNEEQSATPDTSASKEKTEDMAVGDTTDNAASNPKDLKVSILGDSYSSFEGYIPEGNLAWYKPVPKEGRPTDVTNVDQTWWKIYIDENGYQLDTNNSYSGATVCNTGYGGKDYTDQSFVTRLTDIGDPDIILVFGGTNDSWADSPLGEYVWENWSTTDLYSYRPATAYMVNQLQTLHPDAEIIMIVNDDIKDEVKESTAEICNHYNIKCVQLDGISKMSQHPDSKGMRQIAEALMSISR